MATSGEKKALAFVSVVLLLGAGVRWHKGHSKDLSGTSGLDRQIQIATSLRDSAKAGRAKKPKKRRKKEAEDSVVSAALVDLDNADAAIIEALKGIGPKLAATIVADREKSGPFRSLEGLQRVRGIGPALAEKLRPHVTFSGVHP